MKARGRHIMWFFLILLIGGSLLWWAAAGYKRFAERAGEEVVVEFTGMPARYVSEDEVRRTVARAVAGRSGLEGIREAEEALRRNPFIDDVQVYWGAAGRMHVRIRQFTPVAVVEWQRQTMVMDSRGRIKPVPPGLENGLPRIKGFRPGRTTDALYPLVMYLRDTSRIPYRLAGVVREGKDAVVRFRGAPPVRLGDTTAYKYKIAKTMDMYDYLRRHGKWHTYREIDVRFAGQVVCKK
ncbi:MAG: hypothetical protein GXO27_01025 [Chlorobi bacterium]|nr:hypothetical protein [Chlorobiota bacterium]